MEILSFNQSIFKKFIGKEVTITLSNNLVFFGILISIDGYMNLAIQNLKTNVDSGDSMFNEGLVKANYELACIRGACVENIALRFD